MLKRIIPTEVFWFVATIWVIFFVDLVLIGTNFNTFGIRPRTILGLPGIFLSPFLHGSLIHLISNTISLLILSALIYLSAGSKKMRIVMWLGALVSGLGVWAFGSDGITVGASGIIYAFIGFLFFDAYFNPTIRSWLFAIISFVAYSGTLISFVSFLPSISWAGHFWGFASGILLAYLLRHQDSAIIK